MDVSGGEDGVDWLTGVGDVLRDSPTVTSSSISGATVEGILLSETSTDSSDGACASIGWSVFSYLLPLYPPTFIVFKTAGVE